MNSEPETAGIQDPLTYRIIGEAMRVHTDLGPGLDEVFYHELLARRLASVGLECESRARGHLQHRGREVDRLECDLRVDRQTVVELKVLAAEEPFAPEHLAQILCYLKDLGFPWGVIANFGKTQFEILLVTAPALQQQASPPRTVSPVPIRGRH